MLSLSTIISETPIRRSYQSYLKSINVHPNQLLLRANALAMSFRGFGQFFAGYAREKLSNCVSPTLIYVNQCVKASNNQMGFSFFPMLHAAFRHYKVENTDSRQIPDRLQPVVSRYLQKNKKSLV
jgi:hypothetical protein